MAEPGKIRVVRCPKCEKLLPELSDYSVYRCGGCDATLQAKKPVPANLESSSVKIDEERIGLSDNIQSVSAENVSPQLEGASEANQQRKEASNEEQETNLMATSPSSDEYEAFYAAKFRRQSKAPLVSNPDDAKARANKEKKVKSSEETDDELQQDSEAVNWRRPFDRDRRLAFRTPRAVAEGVEFSRYPDHVGPSNYDPASDHRYVEAQACSQAQTALYLEQDRAEILRKIDELRNQLSRSSDLLEKPHRHVAPPPPQSSNIGSHDRWLPGPSSSSDVRAAPFYRNEYVPVRSRYDLDYYHPPGDPYMGSQILRRGPFQSHEYPQRSSKDYLHGHVYGIDDDPTLLYPNGVMYDQPPCSCLACRNEHLQVTVQGSSSMPYDRRLPKPAMNQVLHPVVGRPTAVVPGGYDYRRGEGAFLSSHVRNPSDLDYDSSGGGIRRLHAHRSVDAKGNARMCLPAYGAAPFVTCGNCFELLQLPKKMERSVRKLRCGSCSEVITVKFDDRRLVFSVHAQAKRSASQITCDSEEVSKEVGVASNAEERVVNSSDDDDHNDDSPYPRPVLSLVNVDDNPERNDTVANLSESEDSRELSSTSISMEGSLETMETHWKIIQMNADASSSLPTSPMRGRLDYSPTDKLVGKFGKGSRSNRSEPEKIVSRKGSSIPSRQNSVKDVAVATEMEYSVNEYPNSRVSHDSEEISKVEGRPRLSRHGDSFFAGLLKKSFKDFGRSNHAMENGKSSVSVNGQPISGRLIKRAEKQAGRIQPGNYWYDYQAGFWGVMGHQCLGIIPPFIDEFNHPMPKNCSGGDTGVFVNGRELHHRDLDLLSGRGLPTIGDKSYTIEISGRVYCEISGEELDCLGKLAPTVEKAKHGFGMRVPRVLT